MGKILYITLEQAVAIHAKTIEYSGGGVYEAIDLGRLKGILEFIQNDDYYSTFAEKLTYLFFASCRDHCFEDGNKRIAITLSAQFLLLNGYMAVAKNFFTVTENISYYVAAGKITKDLLLKIMIAILDGTYDTDEEIKLEIINAIKD